MSRVPILPVLAGAVVLFLWALSGGGESDPAPKFVAEGVPSRASRGELSRPRDVRPRERPEVVRTAPVPPAAPAPIPGGGALAVKVLGRDDMEPLSQARLVVYDPDGSPADVTGGRWAQVTGADGRARFELPAGRPLRLAVRGTEVGMENSSVELEALTPGELRNLTVQLGRPQRMVFHGVLLDAVDGTPLAGVELRRLSLTTPSYEPQLFSVDRRPDAWSDEEGHFQVEWPTETPSVVQVHTLGYGPMFVRLDGKHHAAAAPARIFLDPSAAFELEVGGRGGHLGLSLQLETAATTTGSESSSPTLGGNLRWRADVGEGGGARILGLAPGVPMIVSITRGGAEIYRSPAPIVLDPSERRVFRFELEAGGAAITGLVRNQAGEPLGNREVWLVPASFRAPELLDAETDPDNPPTRTKTNAAGRFQFHDAEPGDWWVGPAPTAGKSEQAEAPLGRWIHLPDGLDQLVVDLTTLPGVFLEGVVRDPDGEGLTGAILCYRRALDARVLEQPALDEGQFQLGPLLPGLYDVWVKRDPKAGHQGCSPRTVKAGGQELVLRVRRGAWIHVQGIAPGEARSPRITRALLTGLAPTPYLVADQRAPLLLDAAPPMESGERPALHDSTFELSGLEAGSYAVTLFSGSGLVGVVERLETREVRGPARAQVPMEPVAWLVLEREDDVQDGQYRVMRGSVIVASGTLAGGEGSEIPVPPGELQVDWSRPKEPVQTKRVQAKARERTRVRF